MSVSSMVRGLNAVNAGQSSETAAFSPAIKAAFFPGFPWDRPNSRAHRLFEGAIAPESVVLALICTLDLCSTLFWVAYRDAAEANPLMSFYLTQHGVAGFVLAKMVFLAMPLVIAEWARRHSPRFVHGALRFTIVAYLALYLIGVSHINGGAAAAAQAANGTNITAPDDTGFTESE